MFRSIFFLLALSGVATTALADEHIPWGAMSPEERHERFKQLPPEKQQRIRERREWFKSLPPERREALREKWRNMTPEERKAKRSERQQRWGAMSEEERAAHRQKHRGYRERRAR